MLLSVVCRNFWHFSYKFCFPVPLLSAVPNNFSAWNSMTCYGMKLYWESNVVPPISCAKSSKVSFWNNLHLLLFSSLRVLCSSWLSNWNADKVIMGWSESKETVAKTVSGKFLYMQKMWDTQLGRWKSWQKKQKGGRLLLNRYSWPSKNGSTLQFQHLILQTPQTTPLVYLIYVIK